MKKVLIFGSGILLALSVISSVLACTAAYWSNGPDYLTPNVCNTSNVDNNEKRSYWAVQYPN